MIETQNFTLKPNGAVKSGAFAYSANTETGRIDYSGEIVVGFFHISKSIPQGSFYVVDPALLLSSKLEKVGDQVRLANVTFTVMTARPGRSTVSVVVAGSTPVTGTAVIDTSGEFIRVIQILTKVAVPIVGLLTIEADQVTGFGRGLVSKLQAFMVRVFDYAEKKITDWERTFE